MAAMGVRSGPVRDPPTVIAVEPQPALALTPRRRPAAPTMGGARPGHLAVPVAYWVVRWPLRRRWVDEHDAKIKQASRGATPRDAPGGPITGNHVVP